MSRRIKLQKGTLTLRDQDIEGFLERVVTPIGTSGKADVPKRYIGRCAYVIVTKRVVKKRK